MSINLDIHGQRAVCDYKRSVAGPIGSVSYLLLFQRGSKRFLWPFVVMEIIFKNYLIILIIQIYTHVIPLFEGMLLYFKAKKTIFIYLSPVKLKVNVLNFILNFVLIFQLLTEINR